MKSKYFFLICIFFILSGCQSVKDGLAGNKNENSDEFLVKKKNPLVMPPKFMELPEPKDENSDEKAEKLDEDVDVKSILDIEKSSENNSTKSGSAEDFVLKQINN